MGTDSQFSGFYESMNGFEFGGDESFSADLNQFSSFTNGGVDPSLGSGFGLRCSPLDLSEPDTSNSVSSPITSADGDSPSDDNDFSETVLKYISQMLMEEDMEQKPCMFHDPLALQAAEKSLYDVLGEEQPSSPSQSPSYVDQFLVDSPDNGFSSTLSDYSSTGSGGSNISSSVDPHWNFDFGEQKPLFIQMPIPANFVFQSTAQPASRSGIQFQNGIASSSNSLMGSFGGNFAVPDFVNQSELALQFKRGADEAKNFLPKENQLVINTEASMLNSEVRKESTNVVVKAEKYDTEYMPNWLTGKKNHVREDENYEEERSNKQSAISSDEIELSDLFDKVLVCDEHRGRPPMCLLNETQHSESSKPVQNGQTNGGKARAKRQANKEEVDLRSLLILCAQAVSSDDRMTANELLKQIRQHSSPFGDGSQRLAHCFANSLEARLAGTGTQNYVALCADRTSAADMLKAYQAYISACPFKKLAIVFANHNILKVAENATSLHIIDFGILYGFQWPALIFRLARRPGGPPKLRITGIELPQSGFRPAERVQETGRRLAKYCERHNVPFEYNAIAKKWETIQIDDLKIDHSEVLAVNCLFRSKNLVDETVMVNSPRNAVLNLIRKANPDIFVHAIVNGSYSVPFFITRFREALFHFSALFDMSETNMAHEEQMRLKYEKEFYGREVMNVIACEGSERVERPETYKQWQVRNTRAGLKQLPLDPLAMKKLKGKVKAGYHSDFVVDQDGNWMLQGWKGRILYASSAWVAAER